VSKLQIVVLIALLFLGIHLYTQHKLGGALKESAVSPAATPLFDPNDPPTIVAFGDSLTAGIGASPDQSYPAQLSRLLGVPVINAGRSGERSDEGVQRLPSILAQYKPDLLILEEGANDLLASRSHRSIAANLVKMVETAKKSGVRVLLLGFPDPDLLDLSLGSDLDFYDQVARRTGAYYLPDLFGEVITDETLLSDDFVHPNAKGYRLIAEKIYHYLQENP
jgi:lysophospholipase L1-like esterase